MYTDERVREFDAAEQDLAQYLAQKTPVLKRAGAPKPRTRKKSR
jgi:hypothetical protein